MVDTGPRLCQGVSGGWESLPVRVLSMSNQRLALSPLAGPHSGEREASRAIRREAVLGTARRLELLSWLAPLGLLVAWEVLGRLELIPSLVLPAPSSVLATARRCWPAASSRPIWQRVSGALRLASVLVP